jgi:TNF receptor-associated factor 3
MTWWPSALFATFAVLFSTEEVRKKFVSQDRTISLHEMRLSELDLRLQCAETANYEGVLIWKIGGYADRKQKAKEGRIISLYSQPFYTSRYGYKMSARIYLNGDGVGKNTHISLFFVIMQVCVSELSTCPVSKTVTFVSIKNF